MATPAPDGWRRGVVALVGWCLWAPAPSLGFSCGALRPCSWSHSSGRALPPRSVDAVGQSAPGMRQGVLQWASAAPDTSLDSVMEQIQDVEREALEAITAVKDDKELDSVRVKFLGKKGQIQGFMAQMKQLSNEDKPKLGAVVNKAKSAVEEAIETQKDVLREGELERIAEDEFIDVTLPGLPLMPPPGKRHPLSLVMDKASNIFRGLGYDVITGAVESPEIEDDYYCFTALNCPENHPARDMQDTFYLENLQDERGKPKLLRTHTSAVQIREMEKRTPPFRIVAPGRVYRKDEVDATHSPVFHQIEILALDEKGELTLNDLKGTIEYFLEQMFGKDIKVRYRGSFFPFTEPSMEVDVFYKGKWLEVLGCGMVDPRVLRMAGVDPDKYSGFAAGFGVERFAMVTYGIPDIRLFYNGDKRFLSQFPSEGFEIGDDDADPVSEKRTVLEMVNEEGNLMFPDMTKFFEREELLDNEPEEEVATAAVEEEEGEEEDDEDLVEIGDYPTEDLAEEWEIMFQHLVEFQSKHGHCGVPLFHVLEGHAEPFELQNWCSRQRDIREAGWLKEAFAERLEEIGFQWDFHLIQDEE